MNGQEFREALHAGRRVYGTAVTSAAAPFFSRVKRLGLDWVFIDNEHAPLGRESTAWLCQAYAAAGIVPIVRIPAHEPYLATMAADAGALGVIVPYVEDPEIVRQVVGAVKWRPLKGQKLQDLLRGRPSSAPETLEYLRQRNSQVSVIINVESTPALARLDELCSVEGLDGVLIGPNDLSIQLDLPEQYHHPRFIETCVQIIQTARAHGLGAGSHIWYSLDRQQELIRAGANIIAHSGDFALGPEVLRRDIPALRQFCGDLEGVTAPEALEEV
jgi:2-keto-3-deoxy-L-rhamnonate aldolase RhmA